MSAIPLTPFGPTGPYDDDAFDRPAVASWHASDAWFEQRKRGLVAAVLPRPRYRRAFEPGCGVGDLSMLLAGRCDRIEAWDADPVAAADAIARTAGLPGVRVDCAQSPQYWPAGRADLIVISEIGYHLDNPDLGAVLDCCSGSLASGGIMVAAHRRHPVGAFERSGDDVHAMLFGRRELQRSGGYTDDDLRIDVFERV